MKAICLVDTRNHQRYIDECVQSCLAQSVPDGVDFTLHVIDSGSTDGTLERLRRYGDRITVHARGNVGQSGAFDLCLQLDAEILMFCDGDDRLKPNRLRRVAEVFSRHAGVVLVGNSITEVDAAGRPIRDVFIGEDRLFDGRTDSAEAEQLHRARPLMGTSRMAVRKAALTRVLPFARLVLFEADELIFNTLPQLGQVFIIAERLTDYRLHQNNSYQSGDVSPERIARYRQVHEDLLACLRDVQQRLDLRGPYIALSERGLDKHCNDVRAYQRALAGRGAALSLALGQPDVLGFPAANPLKRAVIGLLVAGFGLRRTLELTRRLRRYPRPAPPANARLL